MYLCVLCGSQNKQPLFPYTTLTDWFFITETQVCLLRGTDWTFTIHITVTLSLSQPQTLSNPSVCQSQPIRHHLAPLKCRLPIPSKLPDSTVSQHRRLPHKQHPAQHSLQSVAPHPTHPTDGLVAPQHTNLFATTYCVHQDELVTDVTSTSCILLQSTPSILYTVATRFDYFISPSSEK